MSPICYVLGSNVVDLVELFLIAAWRGVLGQALAFHFSYSLARLDWSMETSNEEALSEN